MRRVRQVQRPAIGSGRSSVQLLVGFALLGPVLLGTSALDSTGRWRPGILVRALILEQVQHRLPIILIHMTAVLFAPAAPRRFLIPARPRCRTVEELS
ncbi:UNVERIFIED_CONTAM: hypothetical protein RF653_17500 [Kocuria sp. CPCC 205316]|uniref:hypothetical protein n=1 Tax=Kocuria TaxID=57493 RepID=UPI0036DD4DD0